MQVDVHDTAEAPVAQGEKKTATGTDARGRRITVRKLTALDRMRMAMVLGAESAANQAVLIYANAAWSVTDIDGEPVFPPLNKAHLEATVGLLDEDGTACVLDAWQSAGWLGDEAQAETDRLAAVKN